MRKKLLIALGVFIGLLAIFAIVVALQPSHFKVTRSATVNAPPAAVFPHINVLHQWQDWSPWAKLDPAAKNTFEGPEAGTGAKFHWSGNDDVGEGTMTITESVPSERILMRLDFKKPFEDTCMTEFNFNPDGSGKATTVTWTMSGENGFISKAFCLFMDMDKMLGSDFEKGLVNLKGIVEQPAKP